MANSKVQYTADGSTQTFAVTFPFISRNHVSVEVDGSAATFSWNNDSQIYISSPTLSGGEKVLLIRSTSRDTRLVDYVDGSNLTETDLDLDSKQAFFMAQESLDELTLINDDALATSGYVLVADGTDFKSVAVSGDVTISTAGAVTIGAGTVETAMIAADAINGTRLADDAVDSEHYTDGSIDTAHIADVNVTTAKIADDAITGAKIALFDDSYAATNTHILVADGTDFDNVAVTGDVTISNSGVTSIASEVIGNADINGSAAIDASKIHNGTVSNTEFGYLNGLGSNIQTQLNGISAGEVSTVQDDIFRVQDNSDNTKQLALQISGVSSGTTRTLTVPDSNDTIVGKATTDTFTNKTFDANGTGNSLSNVDVADLAAGTDGQLITWGADAAPTTVAAGTSGHFLKSQGAGSVPVFAAGASGNLVDDSSPQLGGFRCQWKLYPDAKGGDIASQSPTVVDTDGDYFICTGTTNFSAFTVAADRHFFLEFAAVLTMTHGSGTLDLPSGANITTAAGDVGEFVSTASNVVTCVNYSTASGKALVESVTLANSVTLTNKTLTAPAVTNLTGTFNSPTGTIGAMTLGGAVTGGDQIVSAINLKDYGEVTNALGDLGGGTDAIDLTAGNSVSATVSTGTQTFTFTNPTAGDELCAFSLMLTNGGSQTVNWPGTVDWASATAPTLTASGVDCLVFWTIDGGTIWNGSTVALNLS